MERKIKSFTVTFHHTCNYGAALQTYALQQVMNACGTMNTVMEYTDSKDYKKHKSIKILLKNIVFRVLRFYRKKELNKLIQAFQDFHNHYLTLSMTYSNMDELRKNPPDADILITGSDQVWNVKTNPQMVPARFLDFGQPEAIRFSYAASLGLCKYSDDEKQQISEYLKNFKGISLREKTSAEYISEITGRECETVCDPVLLLEKKDWESIAKKRNVTEKPYILCYCVQGNERLTEVIKKIKKKTGYQVIFVHCDSQKRCSADYHLFDASPEEFLGLYRDASVVITTSFHGTAFALEFGKPVYALVRGQNDTRLSDLMDTAGLREYVIRKNTPIPEIPNDMAEVEERIAIYREQSLSYIRKMVY